MVKTQFPVAFTTATCPKSHRNPTKDLSIVSSFPGQHSTAFNKTQSIFVYFPTSAITNVPTGECRYRQQPPLLHDPSKHALTDGENPTARKTWPSNLRLYYYAYSESARR